MKKKIFIIIAATAMAVSMAACGGAPNKNYVAGPETNDNRIYTFEYSADDYSYIEVFAERYANGERLEDVQLLAIAKVMASDDLSGTITITFDENESIRLVSSPANGGMHSATDFVDIGAPAEGLGLMEAWQMDRLGISENATAPLLFIGYESGSSDHGYGIGLYGMDESIVPDYVFCYRVMVKFYEEKPE